jgi:hypothetical protein
MVTLNIQKIIISFFIIIFITFIYNVLNEPQVFYNLEGFVPLLPSPVDSRGTLLQYYPILDSTGKLGNSDSNKSWNNYPTFKIGSYEQITNNIRYPNNPDIGKCSPISMCNVLYGNRQQKNNNYEYSTPPESGKLRVGFFNTYTPPFF